MPLLRLLQPLMLLPLAFRLQFALSLPSTMSTPLDVDELGETVDVGDDRKLDAPAGGPGSLKLRFNTNFRLSRDRPADTGSQQIRVDIVGEPSRCS